eukprot:gene9455-1661_t
MKNFDYSNNSSCHMLKYLPDALTEHSNFQSLILNDNEIGDEGAKLISEGVSKNNSLEKLYLTKNGIKPEGCIFIAEALQKNIFLSVLRLSSNFCDLEEDLDLSMNLISSAGLKHLGEVLIKQQIKNFKSK